MNKKIIIIGGVAAGMSAASKAKRIDKTLDITVYEMTDAISWGACGLPYYVGDFYPNASLMVARTYEEFQKEGINVKIKHKVENVDFKNKKVFVRNLNENKVFEDDFVAERLADLRHAERNFHAVRLDNAFKVDKNALTGFRTQVHDRGVACDRSEVRLKHKVELADGGVRMLAASGAVYTAFVDKGFHFFVAHRIDGLCRRN